MSLRWPAVPVVGFVVVLIGFAMGVAAALNGSTGDTRADHWGQAVSITGIVVIVGWALCTRPSGE